MSKLNLGIVLTGVLISAPGLAELAPFTWSELLGWLGVCISIVGAVRQYRESRPFEREYATDEWILVNGRAEIAVSKRTHGKGEAATGEIYARSGSGGFHACMAGVEHRKDEIVFSSSGNGFDCKIVIR